jgi:hypothetical protein
MRTILPVASWIEATAKAGETETTPVSLKKKLPLAPGLGLGAGDKPTGTRGRMNES